LNIDNKYGLRHVTRVITRKVFYDALSKSLL
jgi:hypothetical protein